MFILLSLLLAISLTMGMLGITQWGYQHRTTPVKNFIFSIWSFTKAFIGWPILFPHGLYRGNYKCKATHKIGILGTYNK